MSQVRRVKESFKCWPLTTSQCCCGSPPSPARLVLGSLSHEEDVPHGVLVGMGMTENLEMLAHSLNVLPECPLMLSSRVSVCGLLWECVAVRVRQTHAFPFLSVLLCVYSWETQAGRTQAALNKDPSA